MARRSVAVLNSAGFKIGYTTFKAAKADEDAGRAIRESEGSIRLLPSFNGVRWRRKLSGTRREGGPVVLQMERRLGFDER
jgi:hypothetical protein